MLELLLVLAFPPGFALLNAITYIVAERRGRSQWVRDVPRIREHNVHGGAFRRGDEGPQVYIGPEENPRAPWAVRAIAMWSIGMGQMFVPGFLLSMVGLLFNLSGVVAVPGLVLALMIWRLSPELLQAAPWAPSRARTAATYAFVLNAIVLFAVPLLHATMPDLWPIWVGTSVYAVVSIAHGFALRHAADLIEERWSERGDSSERSGHRP